MSSDLIDLRSELGSEFIDYSQHLAPKIARRLNTRLSPKDSMYSGNGLYYLRCGESAARLIHAVLRASGGSSKDIGSVLDYGCGYGRVLRWLKAHFPEAAILGVDKDQQALDAAARVLDVEVRKADVSLRLPLERRFDLIWVGSLFTHVDRDYATRLLEYLRIHMAPEGILVFTTCGPFVQRRIRSGEKPSKLDEQQRARLLQGFDETGYGFGSYPNARDYGLSVCTADNIFRLLTETQLVPVYYESRGWIRHQDSVGAHRAHVAD